MSYKHPYNPIKRNIRVLKVCFSGIHHALRNDPGVLQWTVIALLLTPVAFCIPVSLTEQLLMFICLWLIVGFELLNTGIELTVDRISTDYHELSKFAKDVGSAAVFVVVLMAIVVWAVILYPLF